MQRYTKQEYINALQEMTQRQMECSEEAKQIAAYCILETLKAHNFNERIKQTLID